MPTACLMLLAKCSQLVDRSVVSRLLSLAPVKLHAYKNQLYLFLNFRAILQ